MHIVDEKNTKYHAASLWAQKKQNCSAWKKKNKDKVIISSLYKLLLFVVKGSESLLKIHTSVST